MTPSDRFDRIERHMPDLLTELSAPHVPFYTDDLLAQTAAIRQRPRWTFLERWLPMGAITRARVSVPAVPWRALAVAALLIALVAAALLVAGSQRRLPPPFGPAANGLVLYETGGDLYARDLITGTSRLVASGATNDFTGAYSPDGTKVVFLRLIKPAGLTKELISLIVANADGSNPVDLTGPVEAPDWWDISPDGTAVIYQANEGTSPRLHIVATDGRTPPRLIDLDMTATGPSWLPPAGREVVFRGVRPTPSRAGVVSGIFALEPWTGAIRPLTPTDGDEDDYQFPIPSPDGRFVSYTAWQPAVSVNRMHLIELGTLSDRELDIAPGTYGEGFAGFSPDGKLVLFKAFYEGYMQFRFAPIDGSAPAIDVGPEVSGDAFASFSPDGTKVILSDPENMETRLYDLTTPGAGELLPWSSREPPGWQRLAP